ETRNGNWQTLHAHPGIELLFIHEGSGTVTLGSQQYKLEKNKLFCFQPYQLHKVDVPVSEGLSYIRTNVTFDPSILEPYLQPFPQLQSFVRFLAKGSLKSHVFTISQAQSLEHMYSNFDKVRN